MTQPVASSTPADAARRLALAALVAGALAIAMSPIFVRLADVGPIAAAVHRLALGLPVLLLWLATEPGTGGRRRPANWREAGLLSLSGLFFALDLSSWHSSLHLTFVATATLLANNAPIFVTLGAWLLWRERPNRRFVVSLALSMTGVALLASPGFAPGQSRTLAGDGLALLTGVFYSGYFLVVKRLRRDFTTATIMTWTAAVGAILLMPAAWIMEGTLLPASLVGWLAVLGLALFSHVGGQSLITYAMAHLAAAYTSLVLLLQPVGAAILAWLMFGEILEPLQLLGAAVVLYGIWLARR